MFFTHCLTNSLNDNKQLVNTYSIILCQITSLNTDVMINCRKCHFVFMCVCVVAWAFVYVLVFILAILHKIIINLIQTTLLGGFG